MNLRTHAEDYFFGGLGGLAAVGLRRRKEKDKLCSTTTYIMVEEMGWGEGGQCVCLSIRSLEGASFENFVRKGQLKQN